MADSMQEAFQQAGVEPTTEEISKPENRRAAMERAFDSLQEKETSAEVVKSAESSKEEVPAVEESKKQEVKAKPIPEKAKEQPTKLPDIKKSGQQKPEQQQQPISKFKPPVSWKPNVREHWAKLPPEVQEEVSRREQEITRTLQESAAARKFGGEFHKVVQPYENLIRSSGVTPLVAIQNLMNTAAGLQVGTPSQKASIVANIIKTYGVDIAALDQLLAGQKPKDNGQDEVLKAIDQRLQPVNEFITQVRGSKEQQQQQLQHEMATEAEQFAGDPANEFFNDLKDDIADLLEVAANRGRVMSLKEAYDLAAGQHPEISKVIKERESATQIAERAKSLENKRRASSSQGGGTPAGMGPSKEKPKNRRDAISMAWDNLSTGG